MLSTMETLAMEAVVRAGPVKLHKPAHWTMDVETDSVVDQVTNNFLEKSNDTKKMQYPLIIWF